MKKFIRVLLLTMMPLLFTCCTNDIEFDNIKPNLPYVSLPDNADLNALSLEDIKLAFSVSDRFNIIENEDGLFELKTKSAKDVNVSENIYQFYVKLVENSNEYLLSYNFQNRSKLISRSSSGQYLGNKDCASWSVAAVHPKVNYNDVSKYFISEYGTEGIPEDKIYTAFSHFGTLGQFTTYPEEHTFKSGALVVVSDGNNLHAVVGICIEDGYIDCVDYQTADVNNGAGKYRRIPMSMVKDIYWYVDYNIKGE